MQGNMMMCHAFMCTKYMNKVMAVIGVACRFMEYTVFQIIYHSGILICGTAYDFL